MIASADIPSKNIILPHWSKPNYSNRSNGALHPNHLPSTSLNQQIYVDNHLPRRLHRCFSPPRKAIGCRDRGDHGSHRGASVFVRDMVRLCEIIGIHTHTYGCGSKCKVWIKPRSHKRSRPLIQTPDPDLSNGVDPDFWNDRIFGRVDVCSYSPCQASNKLL